MKRLIALMAVGAAVAAVLAVPSVAVDTKGPPCADIVSGDGSYDVSDTSTEPPTPLLRPSLTWRFDLASPSCAAVTYTLYIYNSTGTTLLATKTVRGESDATSVNFSQTFNGTGEPLADPAGVCLVGTTSLGRHVADRAPDGENCAPVTPGSSGGVGFQ